MNRLCVFLLLNSMNVLVIITLSSLVDLLKVLIILVLLVKISIFYMINSSLLRLSYELLRLPWLLLLVLSLRMHFCKFIIINFY